MTTPTYIARRDEIETYFDRTAADTWSRLTSDAPVSGIRATVRAGRERMRGTLLAWLPRDLRGRRVLDAGCGTGAMALELARRGADVVAVDLSPTLVQVARQRWPAESLAGCVEFRAGDMLDPGLGRFDHVVSMDSLIHYRVADVVRAVAALAERTQGSMVFTFAPRTPLLAAMHAVGRLFPRGDRAPAIEPVGAQAIARRLRANAMLSAWQPARTQRITSGFYMSQAMELVRQ
jgi:magnesium-protoporphyrin O-methyltransferase